MSTRPSKIVGTAFWRSMSLRAKVHTRRSEGRKAPTYGLVPWLLGQRTWLVVPEGSPMRNVVDRSTPRARLQRIRLESAADPLLVSRMLQRISSPHKRRGRGAD